MIGVAIPAHDEEASLGACLAALLLAARNPVLGGEAVAVLVVLDACGDGSRAVVRHNQPLFAAAGVALDCIEVDERRVGAARAAGARRLLALGARWLAFTDADTRVSSQWLATQLALDADVVCGSVAVYDWSPHAERADALCEHFARNYQDRDGHRRIHGANLGVRAAAYLAAGGFEAVPCTRTCCWCGRWSAPARVSPGARSRACSPARAPMRVRAAASAIPCLGCWMKRRPWWHKYRLGNKCG